VNLLNRRQRCSVVAAFALLVALVDVAHGEDIDIYAAASANTDIPNVLLILDNSANWSSSISVPNCYYNENGVATTNGPKATNPNKEQGSKMAIEKCALYNVIDALPTASTGAALFNVGIMLFNESPASNSGGYPRKAMIPLTAANKALLKAAISGLGINTDKGNNAAFAKSLYEAYLYLKAATPYKGTAGAKWDRAATTGGLPNGAYLPPVANGCGKNHVIFIANGGPGENTNAEAKALLQSAGGNTTAISYPAGYVSNSDQANWADEFARFMFSADVSTKNGAQSIVTHAVAVTGASSDGTYPNFIGGIAKYGGGVYVAASDTTALTVGLMKIFTQIQSVSSVFASASLPISVNARGTYLNQVFMGTFLPDGAARPRWHGNLKQYRFAYDQVTDSLGLVDKNGSPAISSSTGFVAPSAVSFWTSSSSFWVNDQAGTPPSGSDSPDGEVVAKGATAQILRTDFATDQSGRKVYTCLSCAPDSSLTGGSNNFDTANAGITAAALGVSAGTDRDNLINWVRGTDNAGDERGPGGSVTVRPSIHGDVLHSRPAAINYAGSIGVVVFYGANDGMLHAINGNQTGTGAGETLWSFVPEEVLPRFKRMRDNAPIINFPGVLSGLGATKRDYFVDGPISVYQKIAADGTNDKVYLFIGMRRGGRILYALDVTNPTAPRFLWKKTQADIAVLGETWSEARVAKIKGHSNPVLVMGAGYDAAEDATPAGAVTMGNAVLILDAFDGSVLKSFATDRAVAADVSIVDADLDGYVDRAYAADLGGNIYRMDLEVGTDVDSSVWTVNKLAALGTSGGKKMFFSPDVVVTRDYTAVLVGSGDREKPLLNTTQDYFYTVLDKNLRKGVDAGFATLSFADLVPRDTFAAASSPKGCYLSLDTTGEKVVNAPLTIAGKTYFGTNKPSATSAMSCSAGLGEAKVYSLPLLCGEPTVTNLNGGGLPPSPVAGTVEVTYTYSRTVSNTGSGGSTGSSLPPGALPGTTVTTVDTVNNTTTTTTTVQRRLPFIIGSGANASPIEGEKVNIPVTPRRTKNYWFYESGR